MTFKEDGDDDAVMRMLAGEDDEEDDELAELAELEDDDDDDMEGEEEDDLAEDLAAVMAEDAEEAEEEEEGGDAAAGTEQAADAGADDVAIDEPAQDAGAEDVTAEGVVAEDAAAEDEAAEEDAEDEKEEDDDEDEDKYDDDEDADEAENGNNEADKEEAADENGHGAEGDADGAANGPAKRRGGKPKDPHAPKRPLLPFQQFGQTMRPQLVEQDPKLKSDLREMGKALAAAWEKVPEEEKKKTQAVYDAEKAVWDEKMAVYKQTDTYKRFQTELQDWRDTRDLRKLEKKEKAREGGWPKKPPTGFGTFAAKVREEVAGKGIGVGELGKLIAERWGALPSSEQATYNSKAKKAQEEFAIVIAKYKRSDGYHKFLSERAALETKQALRRLRLEYADKMPKRPPMGAQLYAKDKKVPGNLSAICKAFEALSAEDKQPYIAQANTCKEKFAEDMAAFKASADGVRYLKEQVKAKKDANIRAARDKYLVDAPKRPPAAKALFLTAKRGGDLPQGLSGKALTKHLEDMWDKASDQDRKQYENEAEKLLAEFKKKMEAFQNTDEFKKLKAIEDGGKLKGRGKASGKGKAKAKSKTSKAVAKSSVPRPESMPTAPNFLEVFVKKRRASGAKASRADLAALPLEEKNALSEEFKKLQTAYQEAMKKWEKTPEGKAYTRKVASAVKKAKTAESKDRLKRKVASAQAEFFKDGEPKKPPSAMFLFASSGQKKPGKVHEAWGALSQEEKAKWEAEREKLVKEYNRKMEEFHNSATFKKANRGASKKGGKGSGKAKKTLPPPSSMPKKPLLPFNKFAVDRKVAVGQAAKLWQELPAEEKEKYEKEASAARVQYEKEIAVWGNTAEGKKYLRSKDAEARKQQEKRAREKHLASVDAPEEPTPPKPAFRIWAEEMRAKMAKQEPKIPLAEQAKKLSEGWKNLDEVGRKPYLEKHEALKKEYEVKMKAYRESTAYKKYAKASGKGRQGRGSKESQLAAKEKAQHDAAMAAVYGRVPGAGRGAGRGRGRGRGASAGLPESDSDVMGSDSSDDTFGSDSE